METQGLDFACFSHWGLYCHASQDFIPPHPCAIPSTPTSGDFTASALGIGWLKQGTECLLFTPRPVAMGSHLSLFLPFSFPLPRRLTDVECFGTSTGIYCLHCFFA